jgi:eukaryotic-like serine/threonine-protein kinase
MSSDPNFLGPFLGGRRHRFISRLHASPLSTVYLAEDEETGARVACKVVQNRPGKAGRRLFERFLLEYELIAAMRHPHVVKILDLGVADDHAYIVMEHFEAGSLLDRIADGPIGIERALDYARQIGAALAAIHSAAILHRDLKPGNVMFRPDETLALIDFGLAKRLRLEASLSGTGQIFGTPHYMSPEQGHADETDERSDLYALGCILYEMLAGEKPFTAGTAMGVIYKHANAPRPQLPAAHAELQPLLDRLLAIDPAERFQSASAWLRALGERIAAGR